MDLEDEAHFLTWLRSKDIPEDEAKHRLTADELEIAYDVYDRLTAPAGVLSAAQLARVRSLADEADIAWHAVRTRSDSPDIQLQIESNLTTIAAGLKALVAELTNDNPWQERVCPHCRWPQEQAQ
jgi:hypothetical protein